MSNPPDSAPGGGQSLIARDIVTTIRNARDALAAAGISGRLQSALRGVAADLAEELDSIEHARRWGRP